MHEMLTSGPSSFCSTSMTLRVEPPLDIDLGQSQVHRLLGAAAALQGAGVETCGSHLWHLKGDFSHAGEHGLGLVTIGLIDTLSAALVGHVLQMLGALNARGFVNEDALRFARTIKTVDN